MSSIWSSKWSLTITAVKQILLSRLRHPLRDRLTSSAVMLRMKEAPFRSLFVLRRVPNQQRWVQTSALFTDAHLYSEQQLALSTYRLLQLCRKKETGARTRMWTPMIMCAAVSTPGLRNGNWTRKAKTQGGGWRRGRTTQDCSKYITVGSAHVWQLDDTEGRPSSASSRDRLSPEWLDAVTSAGTTSASISRHLQRKRSESCFSLNWHSGQIISSIYSTLISLDSSRLPPSDWHF